MTLSGTEQKNDLDSPALRDVEAFVNLVVSAEAANQSAAVASTCGETAVTCAPLDDSGAPTLPESPPVSRTFRPPLFLVFLLLSLIVSAAMQSGDWEQYKSMPDRAILDVWQQDDSGSQEHRQRSLRTLGLAAKRGARGAWTAIGYLYATGLPQDPARSKQAYERAILAGDPVAMHNLAMDYETGLHGPSGGVGSGPDSAPYFEKAVKLYERAAIEQNHAPSMLALGSLYRRGEPGVPADKKKAFYWVKRAAESGCVGAYPTLAAYYESGIGVEKDAKKSIHWLERAFEAGSVETGVRLGTLYFYGHNVPVDYDKALSYFGQSGDSAARIFIGRMYENGLGVPKDEGTARDMYESAVSSGSAEGRLRLGLLDLKQRKVDRNGMNDELKMGFAALKYEADSIGDGWVCYLLAQCYEYGYGVDKSMVEAVRWYQQAAFKHQLEAIVQLKKLGKSVPVPETENVNGGVFESANYIVPSE